MNSPHQNQASLSQDEWEKVGAPIPVKSLDEFVRWSLENEAAIHSSVSGSAIRKKWEQVLLNSWKKGDVSLIKALTEKGWCLWDEDYINENRQASNIMSDALLELPADFVEKLFIAAGIEGTQQRLIDVISHDFANLNDKYARVDVLTRLGARLADLDYKDELAPIMKAEDVGPLVKRGYVFPRNAEKYYAPWHPAPPLFTITINYTENLITPEELEVVYNQTGGIYHGGALPLHCLVKTKGLKEKLTLLGFFLRKGENINQPAIEMLEGKTLLFLAVAEGDLAFSNELIKRNAHFGKIKNVFLEMSRELSGRRVTEKEACERLDWLWKKGFRPSEKEWGAWKEQSPKLHPYVKVRMQELHEMEEMSAQARSVRANHSTSTKNPTSSGLNGGVVKLTRPPRRRFT